jgi:acyl-coenzyme A thioesterase PaaI-like protein
MVNTHKRIDKRFSGEVVENSLGYAKVLLKTSEEMLADQEGLIHGGFTFSAADYATMVAVNEPNVVLLGAEVKFMAPVKLGDSVEFIAKVKSAEGRKAVVDVVATVAEKEVFSGIFTTYTTKEHILSPS